MNVQYNSIPNKFARKRSLKRKNPYSTTVVAPAKRQQLSIVQQAQARRIAKQVVSANTDYRITDYTNQTNVDWTGAVFNVLSALTRGDADKNEFEGNTIFPKYWELRYIFRTNTASDNTTRHAVRIILGQLIEGATVPSVTDVLETTGTSTSVISAKNNVYSQTFNILHDQIYTINHIDQVELVQKVFIPDWKLNKIKFQAASTNIVSGGLFVYVIGDDTAIATQKPNFEFYSRVMFST